MKGRNSKLFVCSFVCGCVCLFVCLLVYVFVCLLVCLLVCVFMCVFVCSFVCVWVCLVSFFYLCLTYLEIAIEGAHVLAQCASDLCRSTAIQYIKIRDGTTIPFIKGEHYHIFSLCWTV